MEQFPKYKHHPTLDAVVVNSVEEEDSLGDEWADSPAEHGIITAPSVEQTNKMKIAALAKSKDEGDEPSTKKNGRKAKE